MFWSNRDIALYDRCNANPNNHTHLGGASANDTGIDDRQVFTGEYHFTVKEIEVFVIDS
jgi:hypothetical protein